MSKQSINAYQFINQACSLLSQHPSQSTQIIKALKIQSQKIKTTTKTVITHGRSNHSKIITQKKITNIQLQSSEVIKTHSKKLFEQLFRNRVKSISQRIELLLNLDKSVNQSDCKFIIFGVLQQLDSEYDDLVFELSQAKKYSKNKQFQGILNLEILNPSVELYMSQLFKLLPQLQSFFINFQYKKLTIDQINQLTVYRTALPSIKVDIQELIANRKKKNQKKKNKKKKNCKKQINQAETETKTSQTQQICQPQIVDQSQPVINMLMETIIPKSRKICHYDEEWLESLAHKFKLK